MLTNKLSSYNFKNIKKVLMLKNPIKFFATFFQPVYSSFFYKIDFLLQFLKLQRHAININFIKVFIA